MWLQLNRHFHFDLTFPVLSPQTAILGLFNDSVSNIRLINYILLLFINYILLLFKFYIYKSQNKHRLNINELLTIILKVKKLEKATVFGNVKKVAAFLKNIGYYKWKTDVIE